MQKKAECQHCGEERSSGKNFALFKLCPPASEFWENKPHRSLPLMSAAMIHPDNIHLHILEGVQNKHFKYVVVNVIIDSDVHFLFQDVFSVLLKSSLLSSGWLSDSTTILGIWGWCGCFKTEEGWRPFSTCEASHSDTARLRLSLGSLTFGIQDLRLCANNKWLGDSGILAMLLIPKAFSYVSWKIKKVQRPWK